MKNKRIRYPVLNESDIIDEEDLDESTNNQPEKEKYAQEAKETKQKKKKQKKYMEKSKSNSTKSIVEKFLEVRRKEYDQQKCGEHPHERTEDSQSTKSDETEQKQTKEKNATEKKSRRTQDSAKKFLEVRRMSDQHKSEEEFENDQIEETSNQTRSSKNDETKQAGNSKLERDYEKLRAENKKLKALIKDRFEIPEEAHYATEPSSSRECSPGPPQIFRPSAKSTKFSEFVDLGSNCCVKMEAYERAKNAKDASKFITTLAYALWGYKTLAKRCVRQQKNVKKPLLEAEKVVVITRHFKKYLKSRDYPSALYWHEISKINTYLGRAITGAINHLKATKENDDSEISE